MKDQQDKAGQTCFPGPRLTEKASPSRLANFRPPILSKNLPPFVLFVFKTFPPRRRSVSGALGQIGVCFSPSALRRFVPSSFSPLPLPASARKFFHPQVKDFPQAPEYRSEGRLRTRCPPAAERKDSITAYSFAFCFPWKELRLGGRAPSPVLMQGNCKAGLEALRAFVLHFGKAGRKTGCFCLARPFGQGTNALVAWPREPLPGKCGKDSQVFRNREDVSSGNLRNFTMERRFGSVRNRARPVFPSFHKAVLRASRGAGAVDVPFLHPAFRIRAFAESRKGGRCDPTRAKMAMRAAPLAVLDGTSRSCGGQGKSGMGEENERWWTKHTRNRQTVSMRLPSRPLPGF